MIDLNDQLATANGVAGRKQTVHTAGLNWYVNRNVGFMFNYLHGDIDKQVSATNVGAKFDALAARTHIAFQAKQKQLRLRVPVTYACGASSTYYQNGAASQRPSGCDVGATVGPAL